jgi:hypothetical protein
VSTAIFLRLLRDEDKAQALAEQIAALREGRRLESMTYPVLPASFRQVSSSPFAYWVSERIRRLFTELPAFESDGRTVKQVLATADDFRFVRAWWEVPSECILDGANGPNWREDLTIFQSWCRQRIFEGKRWVPFAKGGAYSPYYADLHLVVNWGRDGEEIRNFLDPTTRRPYSRAQNTDFYFRPGLTWPRRSTSSFGIRILPSGCIFADKGPAAFVEAERELPALGILFSKPYQRLIEVGLAAGDETHSGTPARSYEVGIIQKLPWPDLMTQDAQQFTYWVNSIVRGMCSCDMLDETARFFVCPIMQPGRGVREEAMSWQRASEHRACELPELAAKIDSRTAALLELSDMEQQDAMLLRYVPYLTEILAQSSMMFTSEVSTRQFKKS